MTKPLGRGREEEEPGHNLGSAGISPAGCASLSCAQVSFYPKHFDSQVILKRGTKSRRGSSKYTNVMNCTSPLQVPDNRSLPTKQPLCTKMWQRIARAAGIRPYQPKEARPIAGPKPLRLVPCPDAVIPSVASQDGVSLTARLECENLDWVHSNCQLTKSVHLELDKSW
ncbi:hypothetical protein LIA77_08050 [Sarocladium implicatum]|nr:hypothetical protein LIA77_08050 [Sarocladium implicatum]